MENTSKFTRDTKYLIKKMSAKEDKKFKERKARILKIVKTLKKLFPKAKIALRYRSHWELLVAVVLSAQTTDKKVNEVTPKLFQKYKALDDYTKANLKEFEKDIREIGLYKTKSKNILATAKIIKEKYKGKIPKTIEELTQLPGVGRKTANIILGNAYGIIEGIAVDTHVRRLSLKFDLTDSKNPNKIEQDLMKLLPKKEWFNFPYQMITYGRTICSARPHDCKNHPLTKIYPPAANRWFKAR